MDSLDDLLRPVMPSTPDLESRARVYEQTLRELHRQRRRRRMAGVGALLGAYAAGLLTMLAIRPPDVPLPREQAVAPQTIAVSDSAVDLEWRALEEPAEAAKLYHAAGDRYLAGDDPANAVRCYTNALDTASEDTRDVQEDDNWLLMTIKLARRKEAKVCDR